MLQRGGNPEFSEITRPTSNKASSWMNKVIRTIMFLKMYRFNVQNWLLGQNLSFYFWLLIIEQTRWETHFLKRKMALLAQISVSYCNIETGNDFVVVVFAIFYVYNTGIRS